MEPPPRVSRVKKLSPDEKNQEIMRCLPLLIPLGENIANLKDSMNEALDKITKLEHEFGINHPNNGSIDDIETFQDNFKTAQFNSLDNINKTSSINSSNRSRDALYLSGVSSFTQPLPDISGENKSFCCSKKNCIINMTTVQYHKRVKL